MRKEGNLEKTIGGNGNEIETVSLEVVGNSQLAARDDDDDDDDEESCC